NLAPDDVIVDWLSFDYGNDDKNPVKNVTFYYFNDDTESFEIKEIKGKDVSYFLPIVYKEEIIRIYLRTKEEDKKDELKKKVKSIKYYVSEIVEELGLIEREEESNKESEQGNDNIDDEMIRKDKRPNTSGETSQSKKTAVVSDNGSNVRVAREILCKKYPHILNLRCMPHCINLITEDLCKHKFVIEMIHKIGVLHKYFTKSHVA
ncbi:4967_t:CDS:2, partial [Racocetra persica]